MVFVMIFLGGSNAATASFVMVQTLIMVCVFCSLKHSLLMAWKVLQIGNYSEVLFKALTLLVNILFISGYQRKDVHHIL